MRRQTILIIGNLLISFFLYGQRGTISIKKSPADTINIIGQWIRVYDKTASNKIIKLDKDDIDTLNFYQNNKFFKQQAGSKEYSTWSLDQNGHRINRTNVEFTMFYEGRVFDVYYYQFSSDSIGMVTKDTLTLLDLIETSPLTLDKIRYYYKQE